MLRESVARRRVLARAIRRRRPARRQPAVRVPAHEQLHALPRRDPGGPRRARTRRSSRAAPAPSRRCARPPSRSAEGDCARRARRRRRLGAPPRDRVRARREAGRRRARPAEGAALLALAPRRGRRDGRPPGARRGRLASRLLRGAARGATRIERRRRWCVVTAVRSRGALARVAARRRVAGGARSSTLTRARRGARRGAGARLGRRARLAGRPARKAARWSSARGIDGELGVVELAKEARVSRAVITGVGVVSAFGVGRARVLRRARRGARGGRPDPLVRRLDVPGARRRRGPRSRRATRWRPRSQDRARARARRAEAWRDAGCGALERGARARRGRRPRAGVPRGLRAAASTAAAIDWARAARGAVAPVAFRAPIDGTLAAHRRRARRSRAARSARLRLRRGCARGRARRRAGRARRARRSSSRARTDSMVNPLGLGGMARLGAPSPRNEPDACRPFDRRRDGLAIGEGAAFFVVENEARARARGARAASRAVLGWGSTQDALPRDRAAPRRPRRRARDDRRARRAPESARRGRRLRQRARHRHAAQRSRRGAGDSRLALGAHARPRSRQLDQGRGRPPDGGLGRDRARRLPARRSTRTCSPAPRTTASAIRECDVDVIGAAAASRRTSSRALELVRLRRAERVDLSAGASA